MAARYSAPAADTAKTGRDSDALPDYVLERNRLAIEAGLTITKQVIRAGKVTTWYEGSETQWRDGPFPSPRKKPYPQKKGAVVCEYFEAYTPIGTRGVTRFPVTAVGDGQYRGSIANEPLPEWVEDVGDGVTAYAARDGNFAAIYYVGPPAAMKDRNIVPKTLDAPKSWGGSVLLEDGASIQSLDDDLVIYRDPVGRRERDAEEEAEKRKKDFKTPSAMLAEWAAMTRACGIVLTKKFERVETKQGTIFTVTPDAMSTIQTLTDELVEAIRCAQVSVRDAEPRIATAITRSRADRGFAQFMARAGADIRSRPMQQ